MKNSLFLLITARYTEELRRFLVKVSIFAIRPANSGSFRPVLQEILTYAVIVRMRPAAMLSS